MIIRLTRSILVLLISTMVLMGQGSAYGDVDDELQMRRGEAGFLAAEVEMARNGQSNSVRKAISQDYLPVPILATSSSCCVCGPSAAALAKAPACTFAKLTRATGPVIFEAFGTPPPHDPPRI